jgi:hypothetical protein
MFHMEHLGRPETLLQIAAMFHVEHTQITKPDMGGENAWLTGRGAAKRRNVPRGTFPSCQREGPT